VALAQARARAFQPVDPSGETVRDTWVLDRSSHRAIHGSRHNTPAGRPRGPEDVTPRP
jgi:hypothetical protein